MSITYDNYLEHYGVKGMKWGVRKDSAKTSPVQKISDYKTEVKGRYNKDRTRELRKVEVTSKNGEKVVATEDRSPKFASFISSLSNKGYQNTLDNPSFSITVDGEKVGESSFYNKRDGEIHLVWLGINPQHRGKGYASSVFDAAVEYGKSEGADKLTLEVPGFSPDARHIYERRGFKVTKEPTEKDKKKDIIWGGLTHMQLDLNEKSLAHTDRDDLELERAFELTFAKLPNDVEKEVFGKVSDVEHGILTYGNYLKHHGDKTTEVNMTLTYDNYLEHYGVKGMKWGVRKDEAVLTRISRSKNTTYDPTISKADRKAERKEGKAAYKEYKKNTNRKERKQDRKQATAERGQYILEESLKNPTGFVSTRMMMPNGTMHQSTMTGRLLVEQLSKGRVVDMRNTQLTMLEVRKK